MAQWDVYPNPNLRQRATVPYLVELQSNLLSTLATRWVAPLALGATVDAGVPRRLSPSLTVEGMTVVLRPQLTGAIDARMLKTPVQSLRAHAHAIADALDAVISGV